MAIVIVLIILTLFLEYRLAFWVMMGMAISFIGGIVFLPLIGREYQYDLHVWIPGCAGYRRG